MQPAHGLNVLLLSRFRILLISSKNLVRTEAFVYDCPAVIKIMHQFWNGKDIFSWRNWVTIWSSRKWDNILLIYYPGNIEPRSQFLALCVRNPRTAGSISAARPQRANPHWHADWPAWTIFNLFRLQGSQRWSSSTFRNHIVVIKKSPWVLFSTVGSVHENWGKFETRHKWD